MYNYDGGDIIMNIESIEEKTERLLSIGLIMDSIGISTVELAEKLKEHIQCCPGGRDCLQKLLAVK